MLRTQIPMLTQRKNVTYDITAANQSPFSGLESETRDNFSSPITNNNTNQSLDDNFDNDDDDYDYNDEANETHDMEEEKSDDFYIQWGRSELQQSKKDPKKVMMTSLQSRSFRSLLFDI